MIELFGISLALLAGLLMTRATNLLRLPDVTAYLIAGVCMGPCVLGKLGIPGLGFQTFEQVSALQPLSDVALGFIAFAIGSEFRLSHLRETGRAALIVGVLQALSAMLMVDIVLLLGHVLLDGSLSVPAAITLGAIATATAPAATLMVVRQYKAKGPVTDILLPVVALDDAVGLVVFAISFGAAQAMTESGGNLLSILAVPLAEIVLSLGLGALLGWGLVQLEKIFHSNRNRVALIAGVIVLTVALSKLTFMAGGMAVGFSPLLVCMMLGTVFCNTCPQSGDLMSRADKWSAPLLTLFFVLSGAELDFTVFSQFAVIAIGAAYILARAAGKCLGARWSAGLARCAPNVRKYLGVTLLPQAGVALGMCAQASAKLGADGALVRNIVLFGVLVYELAGPALTKWALTRAGDIVPVKQGASPSR